MGSSLRALSFDVKRELFLIESFSNSVCMVDNVHPGRRQGSDVKACSAHSAKIAVFSRVFWACNQSIEQPTTFLFILSIFL